MTNLREKNYQVYKDIEGLDEMISFLKTYEEKKLIIYDNYFQNIKAELIEGIYFEHYSRKRFFCKCGYVGSSLDSTEQPRCHNCGNVNFGNHYNTGKDLLFRYFEPSFENNEFKLYSVKYYWEGDTTIKLQTSKTLVASVNKDNVFIDIMENTYAYSDAKAPRSIVVADFLKIFSVLPENIKKQLHSIILVKNTNQSRRYKDIDFFLTLNILRGILNNKFNIEKWKDNDFGIYLFEMAIFDKFSNMLFDPYSSIKKGILYQIDGEDLYNFIITFDSPEDIKDLLNITMINEELLKKLLIPIQIMPEDLRNFAYEYNKLSDAEQKATDIQLLNKNHLWFDSIKVFNKGKEKANLLLELYNKEKHIHKDIEKLFISRESFLKKEYPTIAIDKNTIMGKNFEIMNNRKKLTKIYKLPEDKVDGFLILIERDPLEAYKLISNRRALNKKEIQNIYKK